MGNIDTAGENPIEAVLIIEDEADIRLLLKRHFERKSIRVLEARTLAEAYKMLPMIDEHALITLDLNLPDGSGLEFLRKFRSDGIQNKTIVCSAYSDLKQEAMASGANGFLAKPIQFATLDEAIRNSVQ